MITRTTNQTLTASAHRNLQASMTKMADLQEKGMTQAKLTRPSDDPQATAASLQVRAEQAATDQYTRNIANGSAWFTIADSALTASTDLLNRVRFLTIQGASDTLPPQSKEAIALELEQLREELLNNANAQYLGRSVFAGTSDAGNAFGKGPDYAYTGIPGSSVERRVGPGNPVRVDSDGARAFGQGPNSIFAVVDSIVTDLRTGVNVGGRLAALEERHAALIGSHAELGTRHAELLRAEEANMDRVVSLEARRSNIEDVDMGQVILELNLQETNYRAALAVSAKVLQPTLMDFLR